MSKLTKEIDLSTMTNSNEILPQYHDQLETEINDIFIWTIVENAITKMTKKSEKENRVHYSRNYTRFSDYTSHQRKVYTTTLLAIFIAY